MISHFFDLTALCFDVYKLNWSSPFDECVDGDDVWWTWRHKLQGLLSQWDGDDVWRIWRQGLLSRDNFLRSFPSKEAKMAAAHNFFPSWQIQIHTITNTLIHEYKQSQKRMKGWWRTSVFCKNTKRMKNDKILLKTYRIKNIKPGAINRVY